MELAIQWVNLERYRKIVIWALVGLFCMIWPTFVVADEIGGYDTEKLIGMSGVSPSNLVIGRDGVSNSYLDIAMGGIHFHEDDPAFQIISLAPLLLIACAILLMVGLFTTGLSVQTIVTAVVLIYMLVAFITGIQINITGLLR